MSDCLFCGIVDGKIKANIVYQDDRCRGFKDIAPKAPVHILIIPRKHIVSVLDIDARRRRGDRRDFSSGRPSGARARHRRERLSRGGQFRRRCRSKCLSSSLPSTRRPADDLAAGLAPAHVRTTIREETWRVDEWRSATSDMAVQQFDVAANKLGVDPNLAAACAGPIGR